MKNPELSTKAYTLVQNLTNVGAEKAAQVVRDMRAEIEWLEEDPKSDGSEPEEDVDLTVKQRITRQTVKDIKEAADNLGRASGEINCIVQLLKHPKRNRADIQEWIGCMDSLGWIEQDGIVWP